jgi:hypothetical protein
MGGDVKTLRDVGSFPNSRSKPRAPTTQATATLVPIASIAGGGPAQLIEGENENRSFMTIFNEGPGDVRFGYDNRSTLGDDGFLIPAGSAYDVNGTQAVFIQRPTAGAAASISLDIGEG